MTENEPQKLTLHCRMPREHASMESELYDWVAEKQKQEHYVTTNDIVCKALSLNPSFKDRESMRLRFWEYDFMKKSNLVVRAHTRVSQQTANQMESVRNDFCKRLMTAYTNSVSNRKFLLIWMKQQSMLIVSRSGLSPQGG